ncbi:MAG: hypothetical protein ACRD4O_18775 [Bryobacteraceae bacterium]
MMKLHKLFLLTACAALGFFACQQTARASTRNERTILHVHNPIQIPGTVLSPGTYTIHIVNPNMGRDIVQFKNKSDSQTVATLIAIPDKRMQVSGKTKLTFYEPTPGNPPALRAWFYPGMKYGDEFVYPQGEASGIAKASNRYVPAMADSDMQTFQQQANSSNSPSMSNEHIYRAAPNGGQTSTDQGYQKNEQLDQNPSWKQQQKTYHTYATFGNGNGH